MISGEKQYEFITSQIATQANRMYEAFRLFIQLFSAIVGGAIWISVQWPDKAKSYAGISVALVLMVTLVVTVMILVNLRSWFNYRQAQANLTRDATSPELQIPNPQFSSAIVQVVQIICMGLACVVFWIFNPLNPN